MSRATIEADYAFRSPYSVKRSLPQRPILMTDKRTLFGLLLRADIICQRL